MGPQDVCKICGGVMKLVHKKTYKPMDCVCKDSFGWDPEIWKREQERLGISVDRDGRTAG